MNFEGSLFCFFLFSFNFIPIRWPSITMWKQHKNSVYYLRVYFTPYIYKTFFDRRLLRVSSFSRGSAVERVTILPPLKRKFYLGIHFAFSLFFSRILSFLFHSISFIIYAETTRGDFWINFLRPYASTSKGVTETKTEKIVVHVSAKKQKWKQGVVENGILKYCIICIS